MRSYNEVGERHIQMEPLDKTWKSGALNEEKTKKSVASWFSSALIMSNSVLGVGILNSSHAFILAGGIIPAALTQMVSLFFIFLGMVFLAHCSKKTGSKTLQDLMKHYFGRCGLIVTNFCILADIGVCIAYLISIADQVDKVMNATMGATFCNHWYFERSFTLPVIALLLIFPTCFIKNIQNLNVVSYLGMVAVVYVVFFFFWEFLDRAEERMTESSFLDERADWVDAFRVAPTVIFSYQIQVQGVPLYQSMKKPNLYDFTKAVVLCLVLTSFVYLSIGILGVLTFGAAVTSDIFTNYDSSDFYVKFAMVMQVFKIITCYPVTHYGTRLVLDDFMRHVIKDRLTEAKIPYLSTLVLFSFTLTIAVIVPSIGSVISLVGSTEVMLCFIIPGLAILREYSIWESWHDIVRSLGGALLIVVGALVFGVTSVQVMQRLQAGDFSHRDVPCVRTV